MRIIRRMNKITQIQLSLFVFLYLWVWIGPQPTSLELNKASCRLSHRYFHNVSSKVFGSSCRQEILSTLSPHLSCAKSLHQFYCGQMSKSNCRVQGFAGFGEISLTSIYLSQGMGLPYTKHTLCCIMKRLEIK